MANESVWSSIIGIIILATILFMIVRCYIRILKVCCCCCQRSNVEVITIRNDPPSQPQQSVIIQNYAPQPQQVQGSFQPVPQPHSPELRVGPQYHPINQELQQFPNSGQYHNPPVAPPPYGPPPMQ